MRPEIPKADDIRQNTIAASMELKKLVQNAADDVTRVITEKMHAKPEGRWLAPIEPSDPALKNPLIVAEVGDMVKKAFQAKDFFVTLHADRGGVPVIAVALTQEQADEPLYRRR